MTVQTIIENDSVALYFHPENKIIHHEIKKWVAGENLRNLLNEGYDQLVRSGAKKWLSDDRGNSALRAEDEEWAKNDWFPRVLKAGWKYWAIVLPEKIVGQMNLKRFSEEYQKAGINTQVFSSPEEALKWLESV